MEDDNKRQHKRIQASFAARYIVKTPFEERMAFGEKEMDAIAYDFSEGGASLSTDCPVPIGTGILLKFRLVNKNVPSVDESARRFEIQAESRYCTRLKDNSYRVGLRFMNLSRSDREFISDCL